MQAFVTNFNLFTWPRNLCEDLKRFKGIDEIVIIDNNSTYAPLLDWYASCDYTVIRVPENLGHHAFIDWYGPSKVSDLFIHTDPDLDLSDIPDNVVQILKIPFFYGANCLKSGLSIKVDDIPKNAYLNKPCKSVLGRTIIQHESLFYTRPVNFGKKVFYSASIDTTFYLAKKASWKYLKSLDPCFRAAPPYTCRHLPFYITDPKEDPEMVYYLNTCNSSASYAQDLREW